MSTLWIATAIVAARNDGAAAIAQIALAKSMLLRSESDFATAAFDDATVSCSRPSAMFAKVNDAHRAIADAHYPSHRETTRDATACRASDPQAAFDPWSVMSTLEPNPQHKAISRLLSQ